MLPPLNAPKPREQSGCSSRSDTQIQFFRYLHVLFCGKARILVATTLVKILAFNYQGILSLKELSATFLLFPDFKSSSLLPF